MNWLEFLNRIEEMIENGEIDQFDKADIEIIINIMLDK